MEKSKKSFVGHVVVWMLLNGVKGKINRDLNVKTVIFSSLEIIQIKTQHFTSYW
jgi:hypothetical protein